MFRKKSDIEKLENKIVKAFKLRKDLVLDLERVYIPLGLSVEYVSFINSSEQKRYSFKDNTIYININHPQNLTYKDRRFFLAELLFAYVVKEMEIYENLSKVDFKEKIRELTLRILVSDKKIREYIKYDNIKGLSTVFIIPEYAIKERLLIMDEDDRLLKYNKSKSSVRKLFS